MVSCPLEIIIPSIILARSFALNVFRSGKAVGFGPNLGGRTLLLFLYRSWALEIIGKTYVSSRLFMAFGKTTFDFATFMEKSSSSSGPKSMATRANLRCSSFERVRSHPPSELGGHFCKYKILDFRSNPLGQPPICDHVH